MTEAERDEQIELAKKSGLFLPLKAARIRQIQDEYWEGQMLTSVDIQNAGETAEWAEFID